MKKISTYYYCVHSFLSHTGDFIPLGENTLQTEEGIVYTNGSLICTTINIIDDAFADSGEEFLIVLQEQPGIDINPDGVSARVTITDSGKPDSSCVNHYMSTITTDIYILALCYQTTTYTLNVRFIEIELQSYR